MLVDLDNFKRYNDSQGHQAGDELLVASLTRCAGQSTTTTSYSASAATSFPSCLSAPMAPKPSKCSTELHDRWAEVGGPVGFSAGIAVGEQDLLRLADQHMYANKRSRGLPAD